MFEEVEPIRIRFADFDRRTRNRIIHVLKRYFGMKVHNMWKRYYKRRIKRR